MLPDFFPSETTTSRRVSDVSADGTTRVLRGAECGLASLRGGIGSGGGGSCEFSDFSGRFGDIWMAA